MNPVIELPMTGLVMYDAQIYRITQVGPEYSTLTNLIDPVLQVVVDSFMPVRYLGFTSREWTLKETM